MRMIVKTGEPRKVWQYDDGATYFTDTPNPDMVKCSDGVVVDNNEHEVFDDEVEIWIDGKLRYIGYLSNVSARELAAKYKVTEVEQRCGITKPRWFVTDELPNGPFLDGVYPAKDWLDMNEKWVGEWY